MRKLFVLFFAAIFASGVYSQTGIDLSNYGVRVEPDKRVMVVLATLDAARSQATGSETTRIMNTKLSPAGSAFRSRVDSELSVPNDLRQKISTFVTQYRKRRAATSDADIVTPFISMAYSLSQAPDLSDPVITSDLPGDLLDVLDFAPLVREFYRRSGIAAKLDDYVKEYNSVSDTKLRGSAREMVSDLLDYLHTKPQTRYVERVKVDSKNAKGKS